MPTTVADVVAKSATGLTGHPGRDVRPEPHTRSLIPANVGDTERLASLAAGAALLGYGLTCRGLSGVILPALGGALLLRGATGSCPAYQALGVSTREDAERYGVAAGHGVKVEEVMTVNKPAGELFAMWRQFDRLPRFMDHLTEVTMLGDGKSHWVAKAPFGLSVEWDAEIVTEKLGEVIAWRSLPGSDVNTAGSVHFTPAPGNRGTEVRVTLKYDPPAGQFGGWVASFFGEEPGQQVRADLRRFKQLAEAGEIPTVKGQSGGQA
ncbi:MAG TPA: SRPBCC family protein [Fimbriiglobus sp.]|nr:SRPBCC family protein [Fimbriiglobus sp.]